MIEFDASRHVYTANGTELPSVTQIVSPLGADYDEPDELLEGVLDAAADRGSTMHEYIAFRLSGGERDEFELPDAYLPYADAVEQFLAEHTVEPMLVETPLGSAQYAGTPDLVGDVDGVLTILDYKFVSQVAKTKVGAQLAGYLALCEGNGIYPEQLTAVQFMRGDYRMYPVSIPPAREAFGLCLQVHALKNKKHPRGRIE